MRQVHVAELLVLMVLLCVSSGCRQQSRHDEKENAGAVTSEASGVNSNRADSANLNGSLVPESPELLGTVFVRTGATEILAMREADEAACDHAKARKSCFHPSRRYERTNSNGQWQATAIAANHRGSCPKYPPPQRNNYCWSWEY
jgi:hypothetical protein